MVQKRYNLWKQSKLIYYVDGKLKINYFNSKMIIVFVIEKEEMNYQLWK